MYFSKVISCGVLLLLIISDFGSANVRLCGHALTQVLGVVCTDGFNPKNLVSKKSLPLIDFDDGNLNNDIQTSELSSLFMDNLNANYNSLMAKTRRRRHNGVADECCRKPCTMPELLSYCL